MDRIKSFLTLCASIVLTVIAIKRLLDADSWLLFLFGGLAALVFGLFSIFLLFENKTKSIPASKRLAAFTERYRPEFYYSFHLFGLIAIGVAAFFYTPENPIMNGIRIFFLIFCALGITILAILLVKLKNEPSHFSGSQKPHE